MTGFVRRWGKDWDVSPADHVDVRIYVYLNGFCLSVYLSNFVCDMYCVSTIAWGDFKKYTIFYI